MIARAKAVDVSRLDPQLPGMPLGDWFDQALGKGSAYLWTVHPCEEANDSRPRLCANIFARHGDAAIVISFSFPKEEPGMNGQPYPATVMLSGVGDGNQFMGSLHALVEALRRYDAAAKRAP